MEYGVHTTQSPTRSPTNKQAGFDKYHLPLMKPLCIWPPLVEAEALMMLME